MSQVDSCLLITHCPSAFPAVSQIGAVLLSNPTLFPPFYLSPPYSFCCFCLLKLCMLPGAEARWPAGLLIAAGVPLLPFAAPLPPPPHSSFHARIMPCPSTTPLHPRF
jgi:hypothetical protein